MNVKDLEAILRERGVKINLSYSCRNIFIYKGKYKGMEFRIKAHDYLYKFESEETTNDLFIACENVEVEMPPDPVIEDDLY